jgi:large subunit ribosomal protein L13Ae
MFQKRVVIDCRGHILGRLASVVAKELLNGQHVVCVRAEELLITGSFARNRFKYARFLDKKKRTNPKKGPFHFRAPARILWRTIRGMVPHKTKRGTEALGRLKVFEGVPPPYDKIKRVVVPAALRVLRVKPFRKTTRLGRLSTEIGWRHAKTVETLEAKRKVRSNKYHTRKLALSAIKKKALTKVADRLKKHNQLLEQYGY